MKLRNIILSTVLTVGTLALADNYVVLHFKSGAEQKVLVSETDQIQVADSSLTLCNVTYAYDSIDHVTFLYEEPAPVPDTPEASTQSDTISVIWNGAAEPVVTCSAPDVTPTIEGGNVTLTNTNTDTEYTYLLSGQCADGSFTLVSDYKSTVVLDGLSLQSGREEALHLKCGKRVALVVNDGTTNTLSDAKEDNGQKGAIHCKGHLELSGSGTLNLVGNVKHALSSKEYLQIKKTFGTLNITSAAKDGIHAGQYFQMNGGTLNIKGTLGDGIQAEITDDNTDELNGQLIIKGGTLNITCAADTAKALKSDSLMTLRGGTITLRCSGAGSKGIKTGTDLIVGDEESHDGPWMSIVTSGGQSSSSQSGGSTGGNTGGWGGRPGGGGWGPGGGGPGGGSSSSGSSSKAIKCDGTYTQYGGDIYIETATEGAEGIESKKKAANSMNFAGGSVFIKSYDDCINSAGSIRFTGAHVICYSTGNDAIDSNYGTTGSIYVTDGVVISFSQRGGAEMGIDADAMNRIVASGGYLITGGGQQGNMSTSLGSGSKHYKVWSSSLSYKAGTYYSLVVDGKNLLTWLQPSAISSSFNAYAGEGFTSAVTIYSGATASSEGTPYEFHSSATGTSAPMLWVPGNITSGTKFTSFTAN